MFQLRIVCIGAKLELSLKHFYWKKILQSRFPLLLKKEISLSVKPLTPAYYLIDITLHVLANRCALKCMYLFLTYV